MFSSTLFALAAQASFILASTVSKRSVAYYDPSANGGSMLNNAGSNLGEPLNIIISGESSPAVLTYDGFYNFAQAIGFSEECLGFHLGGPQSANLGDGNGWVNQTTELRWDYGSTGLGTCFESLIGGNHLRLYIQNGAQANSGALFLAVSKEEDVSKSHTIIPDGYDVGRNELATAAIGKTSINGVKYSTTAKNVTGLLAAGTAGVNHNIATDGITTLLTVTIV
ncbi:hypothetical protein FIBSPDRAFT_1018170 [Athelia psychrophila]|uniref:Uncharacterized protein n=1 Tax=Athelia psychrophila TaxID=1759441 RepID=A0A166KYZ4_9AGAM|nr:hypothetical protein FIBSPDRAFT_1018170 [Fibularhizoctonia sp. CBS 109695]